MDRPFSFLKCVEPLQVTCAVNRVAFCLLDSTLEWLRKTLITTCLVFGNLPPPHNVLHGYDYIPIFRLVRNMRFQCLIYLFIYLIRFFVGIILNNDNYFTILTSYF